MIAVPLVIKGPSQVRFRTGLDVIYEKSAADAVPLPIFFYVQPNWQFFLAISKLSDNCQGTNVPYALFNNKFVTHMDRDPVEHEAVHL